MRERLQHWWCSRSDRERRFLAAWGAAAAALLVWFGGVSPLAQRIAVLEKRVPQLEGQLMRMQQSRTLSRENTHPPASTRPIANVAGATLPLEGGGDSHGIRGNLGAGNGGDLRSSLLAVLVERGVRAELNPLASSRVEMRLPELPLREALALIDVLRQASATRVSKLDIQVDAQPGGVARTVVELERAP